MPFCPNCGSQIEDLNFCPKCGYSLKGSVQASAATSRQLRETEYYRGQGNMIVKTIRQQGTVIKVGVFLLTGPIGYLFFGRDKKKKASGTGSLIVTNKAIYFAGRDYPFDRIGSVIKKGNSIFVEVDVSKNSAYGSGWVDVVRTGIGGESISVELEIQTNDVDNVSNALEEARLPNTACEYCHTVYSKTLDMCPHCGARNKARALPPPPPTNP